MVLVRGQLESQERRAMLLRVLVAQEQQVWPVRMERVSAQVLGLGLPEWPGQTEMAWVPGKPVRGWLGSPGRKGKEPLV